MKLIQAVKNNRPQVTNSKETVEFRIGDAGKIIDILRSKMYSNPIQTLVQEYLCNARDAVREVKGSKIVVTLNDTELKIRDFGPGISKDRMLNTFVQYGNTTKEGSNNQTGGFGLGSKLAWAYTDRFDIVTFVNGTKFHYVASIGANKNGTLDLISEETTTEANGTEISLKIEMNDFQLFLNAINRAVSLWDINEVPELLIEGEKLESETLETLKLSEAVSLYNKDQLERIFSSDDVHSHMLLSIDGVGYPVSGEFVRDNKDLAAFSDAMSRNAVAVFNIGNGQVEIAASRESINENDRLLAVMVKKAKEATKSLKAWQADKLDSAESLSEFVTAFEDVQLYSSVRTGEFLDSDGEKFTVENYGWGNEGLEINSANIDKLELSCFESDGAKKRRSRYNRGIRADALLIVADESISKARQTMKVTQAMHDNMQRNAILIFKGTSAEGFAKSLTGRLGAILLSSIELPKVERAEARRTPEGFIKVQLFADKTYRSNRKAIYEHTISLETNSDKYVYMKNEDRGGIEQYESLRHFLADSKYMLCAMGAKAIKAVEGNSNFVSLETFFSDPSLIVTKKGYSGLLKEAAGLWVSELADKLAGIANNELLMGSLKDRTLADNLKTIEDNKRDDWDTKIKRTDDVLMEYILKTSKKIASLKELSETFPSYVASKYPLLECMKDHNDTVYADDSTRVDNPFTLDMYLTEIVAYLNGKA